MPFCLADAEIFALNAEFLCMKRPMKTTKPHKEKPMQHVELKNNFDSTPTLLFGLNLQTTLLKISLGTFQLSIFFIDAVCNALGGSSNVVRLIDIIKIKILKYIFIFCFFCKDITKKQSL